MQFTAILSILALSAGVVHAGKPAFCSSQGTSFPANCLDRFQFCCNELQDPINTPIYRGDCLTFYPSIDCNGGNVRCCEL